MYMSTFQRLLKRVVRKAAYQVLMGRLVERGRPERGRFLRHDVDAILDQSWRNLAELLPEAELDQVPTVGNRQNVLLAAMTVASFHAFLKAGIEKEYAIELFADIGWKVYIKPLPLPKLIARLLTRAQKQVNLMLRMFMVFPFSTPGRPGYECKAWTEPDRFRTSWTHCPPYAFIRRYVEAHGDSGELEAFRKSWCWYDWPLTHVMVDGGYQVRGHYERPKTLSAGDEVCDMRWHAEVPQVAVGLADQRATRPTARTGAAAD
jgi:hypothetical protein